MKTQNPHILIIEDNLKFSKLMRMRLENAGYHVKAALDGLQGLNVARSFRPDLILLDVMLPELDGHKISRLLKRDRRFNQIPIIMLTSRDLQKDKDLANSAGVEDYIAKTENFNHILNKIKYALENKPVFVN